MEEIRIQLIKVGEIVKFYWLKIPERQRKILKITAIIFASLVSAMFILSLFISVKNHVKPPIKTTPTPAPQITALPEVITRPSRYATDSAILKIEEELTVIQKDLGGLQINEVNLLPPRLDFNVKFEK